MESTKWDCWWDQFSWIFLVLTKSGKSGSTKNLVWYFPLSLSENRWILLYLFHILLTKAPGGNRWNMPNMVYRLLNPIPHASPNLVESRSLKHGRSFHHHASSEVRLVWLMDQHRDTSRGEVPDICVVKLRNWHVISGNVLKRRCKEGEGAAT